VRSLLILVALSLGSGSCKKAEKAPGIDPGMVSVTGDAVLKQGLVGEGKWETSATYALVDADNIAGHDLLVTLGGELRDKAGNKVGTLRAESLYMPKASKRTFALVDSENKARPEAVSAHIDVIGAVEPKWRPTVTLRDAHLFEDLGKPVIAASVTNEADRPGTIIVFAAFHDAKGRPAARQFDILEMGSEITRTVRFVGPEGARTAYLFLGDATY
jgi:hypothetical protein